MKISLAAPALFAAAAVFPIGTASADTTSHAHATCHGLPVTISDSGGRIVGTPHRDVIRLTGAGTVNGGGGDDVICGSRFADTINAGPGHDVVFGGAGGDTIHGGTGRDGLYGEAGNDVFDKGPGAGVIMGGAGRNRFTRAARTTSTLLRGERAVSILADPTSLNMLRSLGRGFTFSWVSPQTGDFLSPIWGYASPRTVTSMVPGDSLRAFWAQTGVFRGGIAVNPSGENPTGSGDTWLITPHEQRDADLSRTDARAPEGRVRFVSQADSPSASMAVGLGIDGSINGTSVPVRPALALQLPAGAAADLAAPAKIRLTVGSAGGVGTLQAPTSPPLVVDLAGGVVQVLYDVRGFRLAQ